MGAIGERLRLAREEQHHTLRGAAKRLHINEKYLKALEEEDFDALPQGAYLLGFLRNYAVFLGINYRELRDLYYASYGKPSTVTELKPGESRAHRGGFIFTPGKVIGLLVFVASLLLIWYLFNQYRTLTAPPMLELYLPREGDVLHQKNIQLLGRTDPSALLYINGQEVTLSTAGDFGQDYVALINGPVQLELIARNRISNRETRLVRTFSVDLPTSDVIITPPVSDTTTVPPATAEATKLELVVRTVDRVWMSVTVDSGTAQDFILEKGQTKVLNAASSVTIYCGKANATYVSLNGGKEELFGATSVLERTWNTE